MPRTVLEGAGRLAEALGMVWGVFLFDARHRLVTVTGARGPATQRQRRSVAFSKAWCS